MDMTMLKSLVTSTKTAVVTATATTSTGAGSWFGWIPEDVGRLAALVGAVLSVVLIVTHTGRFILDYKTAQLNLAIRRAEAERRRQEGLPVRRDDES